MAEKLYPPIIPGKIPAFYKKEENGTVKAEITVPFSISKGVNTNDIIGFSLQLKTVQNNFICNISKEFITNEEKEELQNILLKKEIVFEINDNENLKKINIGQFFKLQMAFISTDNQSSLIGYYSTVGVIKCTAKPIISIENLDTQVEYNSPLPIYFIKYENLEDPTEIPYTYSFSLYDKDNNEILNKENLLYDSFKEDNNFFFLNTNFTENNCYTLSLEIKTINSLKEKIEYTIKETTNYRSCKLAGAITSEVENNSNNGYISIKFIANENIFILEESFTEIHEDDNIKEELQNSGINNIEEKNFEKYENSNSKHPYMYKDEDNNYYYYLFPNYKKFKIYRRNNINNEVINIYNYEFIQDRENGKMFDISKNELIFEFKDFNIEQGIEYSYFYKEELDKSLSSSDSRFSILSEEKDISEKLIVDFEDIFLSDNKGKQIKIKFNPKISSFKTNHLEQKTETIGNKYPFIFRNGTVEYKEFPISGLISYHLDNNESFITKKELYLEDKILERQNSPYNLFSENNYDNKKFSTTNLTDYNIYAERKFKLALLDWLGNGEIKLFKSPTEGNYLVCLTNISLAPEEKLGRMLHSFSCTAYEVKECNYESLLELGFYREEGE